MTDDDNRVPNANHLKQLREPFEVSQAVFAGFMGVPLRTYEDLEGGKSPVRPIHIRAAEMACLQLAFDRLNFDALSEKLKIIVRGLKEEIPNA